MFGFGPLSSAPIGSGDTGGAGAPAEITATVAGTGTITHTGIGAVVATVSDPADITVTVAGSGTVTHTGVGAVVATVISVGSPSAEPVTLAEAKTAARMDLAPGALDFQVETWITSARKLAEQYTGQEFVSKTKRLDFTDWPLAGKVMYTHQPTAVAISYWGSAGWTALDPAAFVYFEHGNGTGIAPALTTSWPALADVAGGPRVRVDITAGPADPSTVDACVKTYIMAMVAYWRDNPGAATPASLQEAPYLRSLLDASVVYYHS